MIHLLIAHDFDADMPPRFYLGSLAPDVLSEREEKDKTHFRTVPVEKRMDALADFAHSLDMKDEFFLGTVLHLYADYYWDIGPQRDYIKMYGDGWFLPYRRQIAIASGNIFHSYEWSLPYWEKLMSYDIKEKECILGITPQNLSAFLERNKIWHIEHDEPESEFFNSQLIKEFAANTVRGFSEWVKTL